MNYLPSKKFLRKVGALLLVAGGWFYFSSIDYKNNSSDGLLVDKGGVITFSRSINSSNFDKYANWSDLSANNQANTSSQIVGGGIGLKTKGVLSGLRETMASEIITFDSQDNDLFVEYGKNIAAALKPYSSPDLPNETEISSRALATGDFSELEQILAMSRLHSMVAQNLKKIEVPEEIKFRHLFLIRNIEKLSFLDLILADSFEDPKKTIDAINKHKLETNGFQNSVMDLNNFFNDKKIKFNKEDRIMIYTRGIR